MEKCRVCYKDFNKDKIEVHVALCGEVALIKKGLENIAEKMSEYSRQAFLMHSNLTSTANAQRSGFPISDPNSPNSPSALVSSEETPLSEEESTPTKTFRRQSTGFLDIDTIKKMNPEEYTKFMEESNKSIYALNKVLSFSDRIQQLVFLFGEEDDPDNRALVEMQICCKEVKEAKALEFIQSFEKELIKYVEKKLEYTTQNKKLLQIGKTTEEIRKEKFFSRKGNSMKKMSFGSKSTGPMKFREDNGITPLKEESKSPKSPKSPGILGGLRKKPSLAKDHQFFSPLVSKRALPSPGQSNLTNMLKSPVLEAYGNNRPNTAATASTNKLQQMNKSSFLQSQLLNTNSNHIASSHLLMKKTSDGGETTGMSLRDMVKKAVGQKTADGNSMKSPFVGPKSPSLNSSQLSSSQLLQTPNAKQLYKEKATNRKSRFSETTSFMAKLSGGTGGGEQSASPVKQQTAAAMEEIPEESKLAKSRAKSLNALKLIQKVEDNPSNKDPKKFTSLAQTSYIWDKNGEKTPEKPPKADKLKKKKSDELVVIAGASSDPNHKWKRNLPFMESNQVGIDSFRFIRFLGRGAYGVVWLVEHKLTKDPYAMKIIDATDALAQNRMYALEAEQGIYEVLQGDFVVKAVYTFEHDSFICFVTELMIGGDFNSILEEFGRLEKEQAQFYFAELILAVESLHNENIVHRDLKPENILMDDKGHIRLTDFGLSNKQNIMRDSTGPKSNAGSPVLGPETSKLDKLIVKDPPVKNLKVEFKVKQATKEGEFKVFNAKRGSMIRQSHREAGPGAAPGGEKKVRIIGTPDYIAPEILDPERYPSINHEKSVDWWSMGVILYEFMVGIPPFNADTREDIFDNIRHLRMEWPEIGDGEDCMSTDTQDLIKKLLNPNPNTRLGANGASEIKKHHFFEGFDWDTVTVSQAPIIPDCKLDMTDYGQFDGKNHPFSDSEGRKKNKLDSTAKKKFFNMTRIELLQKMTLAKIQQPQKLKMAQSKKPF